jgi:hypothetical protein
MRRLLAAALFSTALAFPQCVMCGRTAAAQNVARQQVMNAGIFILLTPPLAFLVGIVAFAFKRREP